MGLKGAAAVVLVGLDLPEIVTIALIEPVLAVELEAAAVGDIRILEGLRVVGAEATAGNRRHQRAIQHASILVDPHQLLDRVVEREVEANRLRRDGLLQTILELVNQVLVSLLGKAATLIRVEVDVVHVDCRILEAGQRGSGSGNTTRPQVRTVIRVLHQVSRLTEDEVQAHLVVLEGDERQRQTRVTAEPELEWDVENRRAAVAAGRSGVGASNVGAEHLIEANRLVIRRRQ